MRKLILKLFKGIPVEEVDNLLNQEYKKTELWRKKAVANNIKLNTVIAEVEKSSIPRSLKRPLINKIKGK